MGKDADKGKEKKRVDKKVYHKPRLEQEQYYERAALACAKNLGIDIPTPGCVEPPNPYS